MGYIKIHKTYISQHGTIHDSAGALFISLMGVHPVLEERAMVHQGKCVCVVCGGGLRICIGSQGCKKKLKKKNKNKKQKNWSFLPICALVGSCLFFLSDLFCFFLTIVRSFWFFLVHFSAHVCLRWLFFAHVCFLPLPGLFLPFEYFCSCSFLLLVFLFFVFICLCVRSILHIDAHVCSCLPNFALCSSLVLFCRFCKYIYII